MSKGGGVEVVLVPDALPDGEAIVRLVDGVVDGDDNGQDPGQKGQDLVGQHRAGGMGLLLAEGIVCEASAKTCLQGCG